LFPVVLLAVVLLLGPVSVCPAGEVPTSAYANSLQAPAYLLDHESLVFQYPQRAVLLDQQAFVHASDTESSYSGTSRGLGVVFRTSRHAAFLLDQTHAAISFDWSSLDLIQAGWAGRFGPVRVGLAARAAHGRDYQERLDQDRYAEETRLYESRTDVTIRYREAAAGIGWGQDGFTCDIACELFRERFDSVNYSGRSYDDTTAVELDSDEPLLKRVAARASLRLGAGTRLTLGGGYRETSVVLDWTRRTEEDTFRGHLDQYGHEWSVGLALSREFAERGRGRLFARYANERHPGEIGSGWDYSATQLVSRLAVRETADLGLSLERPVWYELLLLAGFRTSFTLAEDAYRREDADGQFLATKDVEESFSHWFSWGLHRSFGQLALTGALYTDLRVGEPFLFIDAVVRF
jgi:hypothetical protein